jgi:hypothetical protein
LRKGIETFNPDGPLAHDRNGHRDLLSDPERPFAGSLEVPERGRTVALDGCFLVFK